MIGKESLISCLSPDCAAWNVWCKMSYLVSCRHLWWGWGKQICREIFYYLNSEAFFPALTLYVSYTPSNSRGNEMPSLGSAGNKYVHATQKNKKKHFVQPDSCLIPAVLKQAEKFLTQPFTEEIITLPFQQCRFTDCFPSL